MIKFLKGNISKKYLNNIIKSFNRLPEDKYLKLEKINYRSRRFSRVIFTKNKFKDDKDSFFLQSKLRNRYLGGIKRKYPPIEKEILKNINHILKKYFYFFLNDKKIKLGYHQIRITCGKNYIGYPVPEGWHKDGFDYVSLINLSSRNITGGISRISNKINGKNDETHYSCFLQSGEFLFFSDKEFFHYTDPIIVKKDKNIGYRDTLVVTFKEI